MVNYNHPTPSNGGKQTYLSIMISTCIPMYACVCTNHFSVVNSFAWFTEILFHAIFIRYYPVLLSHVSIQIFPTITRSCVVTCSHIVISCNNPVLFSHLSPWSFPISIPGAGQSLALRTENLFVLAIILTGIYDTFPITSSCFLPLSRVTGSPFPTVIFRNYSMLLIVPFPIVFSLH